MRAATSSFVRDCDLCGQPYEAKSARSKFCGKKCRGRAAENRKTEGRRQAAQAERQARARERRAAIEAVLDQVDDGRSSIDELAAVSGRVIESPGRVTRAVLETLERAGQVDTPMGQVALTLAASLDDEALSSSGMATIARELRATLAAIPGTSSVTGVENIDELRRRREARRRPTDPAS